MSDKYTLYTLCTSPGGQNVSPFVFITMSDLAILGVPYDTVPLTFPQIRDQLAAETGNDKVTVPTLKTAGGFVTDSWEVAKYLEAHHATPTRSLFHPSEEAVHNDPWVMSTLAAAMRPIFRPLFHVLQDKASQEYFLKTKYGSNAAELEADLDALRDPTRVKALAANARQALKGLEEQMGDAPFLGGERPSHADSAVFGWYLSTRVNGIGARLVWESDENPKVKRWVQAMIGATGLEPLFDVEF